MLIFINFYFCNFLDKDMCVLGYAHTQMLLRYGPQKPTACVAVARMISRVRPTGYARG